MGSDDTPRRVNLPHDLSHDLEIYFRSPQRDGRYRNPWPHPRIPGLKEVVRWQLEPNRVRPAGYRSERLSVVDDPLGAFTGLPEGARLLWLGHATFLIELDGVRLLIDPIFGNAGAVVRRLAPPALEPEALPAIDAVLVTHGHHDHLDPHSLRRLAARFGPELLFVVPQGLGRALPRSCARVVELDWWQEVSVGAVQVALVPAQHWHRRGVRDLNRALWGGYVMRGSRRFYHSGDTGYFGGFRAIGRALGPIDVACLPLGAYEPKWFMGSQHMSPEESVQAWQDLGARHFVGMHWGTFDLSDEPVDAGPKELARILARLALDPQRFHVLALGGSLGLTKAGAAVRAP